MNINQARILVVDDEPILLVLLARWLLSVGFGRVFTATDGEAALAILKLESIDLLLTDVNMPLMDGITLVRRLAETGQTIPSIVFISGFGDVDRREMYGLGVEAFIEKPFDRGELLAVLQRALAERDTLWHTEMPAAPRQSLLVEARHLKDVSGLNAIGLGRGGFSVLCPFYVSPGKLAFHILLADHTMEITGQGYVRWSSRADNKAGVELVFLTPHCRAWLTQAIASAAPRSFIPGS